jgi:sugar (pentulose or hexulose) kinase
MQIFADVFNLPARRNAINGCASLGAAINTAVGLGAWPSYATAVEKMVRVKDVFMPIASNASRYEALNRGIFRELTQHTDVILKKSYEVIHGNLNNNDAIQSWSNA